MDVARAGSVLGRSLLLSCLGVSLACPQSPLAEAESALSRGDLLRAGQAYLTAARRDPALLAAWDGAVKTYCGRVVHVARCLEVLDLEQRLLGAILPRHRDALSVSLEARARARLETGLAEAALEDLFRAARAGPRRASVAAATARAHAMLGRREEAIEALERARRLNPDLGELDAIRDVIPGPAPVLRQHEEAFGGP